ncbi:MAG TPA: hypothetical protein V6D08_00700 [Candidatus Obscuribacterales bacterium]
MKKTLAVTIAAIAALFVLATAQPAHAQSVGIYVGSDGFGVSIGNGHHRHGGWHGGWHGGHHGGWHGGYRRGPVVVPVPVPVPGPSCHTGCGSPVYHTPAPIRVLVWDQCQVWGPYGYQVVRRQVWVTAYWSHHFRAYVWTDSQGYTHVVNQY